MRVFYYYWYQWNTAICSASNPADEFPTTSGDSTKIRWMKRSKLRSPVCIRTQKSHTHAKDLVVHVLVMRRLVVFVSESEKNTGDCSVQYSFWHETDKLAKCPIHTHTTQMHAWKHVHTHTIHIKPSTQKDFHFKSIYFQKSPYFQTEIKTYSNVQKQNMWIH